MGVVAAEELVAEDAVAVAVLEEDENVVDVVLDSTANVVLNGWVLKTGETPFWYSTAKLPVFPKLSRSK